MLFNNLLKSAIFLCLTINATVQATNPYANSNTVFIPYANASTNTDLKKSPTIYISFNGSDKRFPIIMDTGSVGIIASEELFTPATGAKNLGTGHQFYSSSGIIEEGTWWSATQSFYDENGNLLATSNVPVLQVTKIACSKNARHCKPNNHPSGSAVMGIGFARESKQQPRGTPNYNAFLNLQSVSINNTLQPVPAGWVNGYVVTPSGVYLGLTSANTQNAGWVKLAPWTQFTTPQLPEWMPVSTTLDVNGVTGQGHVLLDTGVSDGFLTPPAGANIQVVKCPSPSSTKDCAPVNTAVGVYLPNSTDPVAFYTFNVGDSANLMTPASVHVVSAGSVFFNTSRHVLGGINFIYDNTYGFAGYIWNGMSSSSVGYVIPATTTTTTTVSSSNSSIKFGKKVTFTAKVVDDNNANNIPVGTVEFIVDGKYQTPIFLDKNGQATLTLSSLPPVSHTIQVRYSGDATHIHSISPQITQKVKPPKCF